MDYKVDGKDILLCQEDFDLDDTLDCGQAFRWQKIGTDCYSGYYLNTPLIISCENTAEHIFRLKDTSERDFLDKWCNYLDLSTDYSELKNDFPKTKLCQRPARMLEG